MSPLVEDPDGAPIIGFELMSKYHSGDLVVWIHDLKIEKTGIVLEVFTERLSNRRFPYAKIYVMGDDQHENILLSSLRNISKIKD